MESQRDSDNIDYFKQELERIQEYCLAPLMTKRLQIHKEDPMDELLEVYENVKEMEAEL